MGLTGKTHALPKEVSSFFLKMVCLICQDQTVVLTYLTYLSNFMGLHSTTLRCTAYTHTAAGLAFQAANASEADPFPLPALPQKGYSPHKVPAASDSFSGSSCLRHMS